MPHQLVVGNFKVFREMDGELRAEGVVHINIGGRHLSVDFSKMKRYGTASAYLQQIIHELIDLEHTARQ
jgi:hypothetical protein